MQTALSTNHRFDGALLAPPTTERKPKTLTDVAEEFRALEAREHPDVVLEMRELRMTDVGAIAVPGHGDFMPTDWARRQLAVSLGIRWEKWFGTVTGEERASEINTRLARNAGRVRLRTMRTSDADAPKEVLRAFVSASYAPVSDARFAELLAEALGDAPHSVVRPAVTDRSTSYVIALDRIYRPGGDRKIGDLRGGLIVRNSGVGYASLVVAMHLERLICTNGMEVPVEDNVLIACVHRHVSEDKIRARLAERGKQIGGVLEQGAERLLRSRERVVSDDEREEAFLALLKRARLPKTHLTALEAAYGIEPEASAFGIVSATTRASQAFAPEDRFALERAATSYLVDAA